MKGQYFQGWGFMRFWQAEHGHRAPSHATANYDGEGNVGEFPGAIRSASWQEPYRSSLVSMDAMPRGVFSH